MKTTPTPFRTVLAWTVALAACTGCRVPPPVVVTGTVIAAETLQPLDQVTVSWQGQSVTTDARGRYRIELLAGVRRVSYAAAGRPEVIKALVLDGAPVELDIVLPEVQPDAAMLLAQFSAMDDDGYVWPSEISNFSWTVTDRYGNHLQPLAIGFSFAHKQPVWTHQGAFQLPVELAEKGREPAETMGVYRYDLTSHSTELVSAGFAPDQQFMACEPNGQRCVSSGNYGLHVSGEGPQLRTLAELDVFRTGYAQDLTWAADDHLYIAFDDRITPEDPAFPGVHQAASLGSGVYVSRGRIAKVRPDGTIVDEKWQAEERYSIDYPFSSPTGAEVYYCRRSLADDTTAVWARPLDGGEPRLVAENACRVIWIDEANGRLCHRVRTELMLLDLATGRQWRLASQLREATYRRWSP